MKKPFKWDEYSDQPAQLKDRVFKNKMRKREYFSFLKTFLISLFVFPISIIAMPYIRRKHVASKSFFSMGVDYKRESEESLKLLDELGVERILVRLKLWELDTLLELKEFLQKNKKRKVILKILQDREHIEDLKLLERDLRTIFASLDGLVDIYEIGSTINRAKWGFFSVDEYNRFYKIAYDLKQKEFKDIELIGSGVIDFEFHFSAHTLFNFFNYKYDGVASLLYVDRRGAPENTQLGFNLSDKIAWLSTMVWLSPKSKHALHITETNWPISNTAPYAPTSEFECVSEKLYADYMLRYNLLAFASQQVDSLSWHQLIAAGYGLIDNREGLRKREAFEVYKFMFANLRDAQFLRLDIKRGYYIFQCLVDDKLLQIHWSLKDTTLKNEEYFSVFSMSGKSIKDETLKIGSSPIYIFITDSV
ncbi:MAG: glycosyl hydrolase [Sulfurimonas sp.]|nr:glycosyl hydrolase [Sulfurimonas sp.]